MEMKYISLPAFIISLAIGIFFVYIWGADRKTIYVYPSQETIDKILFQDNANKCYAIESSEVKCPSNKEGIFTPAVQV
jgi:hypothetical protein